MDEDTESSEELEILRRYWKEQYEAAAIEENEYNPLIQWGIRRIYFVSRSHGRGRKRRRLAEVEMIRLPGGRCHVISDVPRNGLDSLAEQIFPPDEVPPHLTPYQFFLNKFRELRPEFYSP